MKRAVIQLSNVSKSYPGSAHPALDELTVSIPGGAITALVGPNGSGKTTLLKLLIGLLAPTNGSLSVFDEPPGRVSSVISQIGYLGSDDRLFPELTVFQNIVYRLVMRGSSMKQATERTHASLKRLRLHYLAFNLPSTLSAGQHQRALLAANIAHDPKLLLLDEPSSALDICSLSDFYEFVQSLPALGKTVLLATHNPAEVHELSTHLLMLNHGRLTEFGETKSFAHSPESLRSYLFDSFREAPACAA